ncbi:MAG: type II secretion system F family protein [Phycisphaeraceae bacterium]
MKLAYQAYDKTGRPVRDTIDVNSRDEAFRQLRAEGLFVTEVADAKPAGSPSRNGFVKQALPGVRATGRRRMGRGRRLKHLTMFTRQLYVLFSTGTPLVDALGALERQTRDQAWKDVLIDLRSRVEEGEPLSQAMESHSHCFDTVYRALVRAGESGGKLPDMLDRLSQLVQRQQKTRNTLAGSMAYPCLLLAVSGGVLTLLLVLVLPRFSGLFETLDVPLPPSTQAMLVISSLIRGWWWLGLTAAIGLALAARAWLKTQHGRESIDTLLLRVPMVRGLTRGFVTARIARLLGTLVTSHVGLLDAIDLTREAAGNVHYRRLMDRAEDAVTRGEPVSTAFSDEWLVSPSVYEAMRSGENTGQLGALLLNMAEFLDDENEVTLRSLTSLLEPIILIVLGIVVGIVATSMFLPLFDLTASAGR